MRARSLCATGSAALALILVGCGRSSSSTTSADRTATTSSMSSSSSSQTPASTSSSATTATRTTSAARRHRPPPSTTTTTTTASAGSPATSTTSRTPATTRTAPPPLPTATPTAPAGLSQTAGYSTYELCSSGCSGAVPSGLRRPLRLPAAGSGSACPASGASGPVRPSPGGDLAVASFIGSAWRGARVTWTAAPSYGGPILIRGRQLGGSGAVGFGEGHVPYDELQLLASGSGAPAASDGGRAWLSVTRVRSPGCYAYQVDGTSFSGVIVFRVTG